MNAAAGNPAQPKGGGCVLADGAVLSAYSVFPNMMTWGFTPSSASNGSAQAAVAAESLSQELGCGSVDRRAFPKIADAAPRGALGGCA
jgi:hypothetical protein